MNDPAAHRPPEFGASVALALAAFALFAALPQRTFHGFDTDFYAALLQADSQRPTAHVAYLPLCKLLLPIVRWWGGGAVHAMWLTSALGSAVGVFCLHRAARWLVDAGSATWVPIAVALTPTCFYFATAAEIHGVFAAGSGASWWLFARWRARGGIADALALGAATGAAATVHALGHLLAPMFVGIAFVQRLQPARALAAAALAIALAHAAVAVAIAWLLGRGAGGQAGEATAMLGTWWHAVSPGAVLAVLWREALCPYLPWSAIALVCLADAGARPWSFAYLVALALHAPVACVFLAQGSPNFDERGAYLLPVAVPAVLASAAVLHGTRRWIALAIAAVISLAYVAPRWAPLYRREFVDAVAEIEREGSFAFLVGPSEIEGVRTHLAGTVAAEIVRSLEGFYGLQVPGDPVVALPAWFDATLRAFPDRVWIVTREAQDLMVRSELPEVRALWLRHVPQAYEQQPVQRRGFDGVALRPR